MPDGSKSGLGFGLVSCGLANVTA